MKYEIEIEGLPEGWKPVRYGRAIIGEHGFNTNGCYVFEVISPVYVDYLIVKKTEPRRIDNCESYDPSSPNGYD